MEIINFNRLGPLIDVNNPLYLLLKQLGCDLVVPITNKYDAFVLGLQFVFACLALYVFGKILFKVLSYILGGKFLNG